MTGRRLFVGVFSLCALFSFGTTENPDAEVSFQTAVSLARRGSMAIGGTKAGRAMVRAAETGSLGSLVNGKDGRWYGWFPPGHAVLGVPAVWAGDLVDRLVPSLEAALNRGEPHFGVPREDQTARFLFALLPALATAACAVLLAAWCAALGIGRRWSWAAGVLLPMATFAGPLGRQSLVDPLAGACVLGTLVLARRRPLDAGFLLGAATGLRFNLLLLIIPLLLMPPAKAQTGGRLRRWALLGLGLAPAGLLLMWANLSRFGDPLETGYGAAVGSSLFSFPPWLGGALLLASPSRGLLFLAPILLMAAAGTRRLARAGHGTEMVLAWSCAVLAVLPSISMSAWHGAWTWGPRYALPALLALMPAAVAGLEAWRNAGGGRRRLATALVGLGMVVQVPGFLVGYPTYMEAGLAARRAEEPDLTEETRTQRLLTDPRTAQPLVQARILVDRWTGRAGSDPEQLDTGRLLGAPGLPVLVPAQATWRGFRSLWWCDGRARTGTGGRWWLAAAALALGAWWGLRLPARIAPESHSQ